MYVICAIVAMAFSAYGQSFLTNGLVAYYPFNGNANDASGSGNNGVVYGASLTTNRFGNANSAYNFAGNGTTYISVPSSPSLVITNTITMAVWIKSKGGGTYGPRIVSKGPPCYEINVSNTGTSPSANFDLQTLTTISTTISLAQTNWIYLVGTYDGQSMKYYTNGGLAAQASITGAIGTNSEPLGIGENLDDHSDCFNGAIDDVRIYNVALTSNQVSQLYAYETTPIVFTNSPVSVTNNLGDNVTLNIGSSGGSSLDYVWHFSGTNIDGGTNTILTITNLSPACFGNYYVSASNIVGTITSSVATIFVRPAIVTQPASVATNFGSPASFSVSAVGYPGAISYQWILNATNIPGATASTLIITNLAIKNTGTYQVLASNSVGTVTSSLATLSMAPYIYSPFQGATPIWGGATTFAVGVIGSGTLNYQWYFNGQPIAGAVYPTLNYSSIQFTNGGNYTVVITSPYGSVTNVVEQVVVNPASVALGFYPGLTITGNTGNGYVIQSCTNLSDPNSWVTLTNLTMLQPVQIWVDTTVDSSSPFYNKYFYRVLPQQ